MTPTEFRRLLNAEPGTAARLAAQRRLSEYSMTAAEERAQFSPQTIKKEEIQAEERIQYSQEELMHAFATALAARTQNKYRSFGKSFRDAVDPDGRVTRESVGAFLHKMLPEADERKISEFIDYAVAESGVQAQESAQEERDSQEVPLPAFRQMLRAFDGKQPQLIWKDFCDHSATVEKLASPEVKPTTLPERQLMTESVPALEKPAPAPARDADVAEMDDAVAKASQEAARLCTSNMIKHHQSQLYPGSYKTDYDVRGRGAAPTFRQPERVDAEFEDTLERSRISDLAMEKLYRTLMRSCDNRRTTLA